MIVIFDTQNGQVYHFNTRSATAKFLGVSLPTLRDWCRHPFFLYRTLVIILTNDKRRRETEEFLNSLSTTYKHRTNGIVNVL